MTVHLSLLLALLLATPDSVNAPPTIPREKGSIVVTDKNGNVRWTADWTMEPAREQGQRAVRFTETGRGQYTPFREDVRWSLEAIWTAENSFSPVRVEKTFTDANGRTLMTEKKTVDRATSRATFERTRMSERPETKVVPVTPATLVGEGIAGVLRFLPFDHWRPFKTQILTNEPAVYDLKVEMRGKERITTPAGVFDCYKVELVPQLGLLNVVRPFAPKVYFWFTVAAPHFWVRYEGPETSPSSPHIVMELKSREVGE
jgi:hypothetical protein